MIKELDSAVQAAKSEWAVVQGKLAAQQRRLDGAAKETQAQESVIGERNEEISRLTTLSKLVTSQRDEATYNLGRLEQTLKRSEEEVRMLADDNKSLHRQVDNLRATMGLNEHA